MICCGIDVYRGADVEIRFDEALRIVTYGLGHVACQPPGIYLSAGFIDLQVNGFAGVDFNNPDVPVDEVGRAIRALFSTGVTRFFPTVITGSPARMTAALRNLAHAARDLEDGEAIAGLHVEGPHISREDGPRGAHPAEWVRPPDVNEFRAWQEASNGLVRMVTVAPEWTGAAAYIDELARAGVVVAIGHTAASGEQIRDAVAAGATVSTHLGNGAHWRLPRHPNYIWEQLAEDRLMASFIADGVHLDAAFLTSAIRAKGAQRCLLVTDASTPAGAAPGPYQLGELAVELTAEGRVVLEGTDRLAGSALRMNAAVSHAVSLAGLDWSTAVAMATTNPARAAHLKGRMAGLAADELADLVRFRINSFGHVEVLETWMRGRRVFAREGLQCHD